MSRLLDPTTLQIVCYPHPTLRRKSKPLKRVDAELRATVGRMFELMYEANGVGLAANQVDLPIRLFIMNVKADPRHYLITRNRFWIVLKRYPLLLAAGYIVPRVFLWAGRAVRYGYFGNFSRGLCAFLRMVPGILRSREVVSAETIRRLREMERAGREASPGRPEANKTIQSPKELK